jgi:hypothetical protein
MHGSHRHLNTVLNMGHVYKRLMVLLYRSRGEMMTHIENIYHAHLNEGTLM